MVPRNATKCQSLRSLARACRFDRSPPAPLSRTSYAWISANLLRAFCTVWSSKPGRFSIL